MRHKFGLRNYLRLILGQTTGHNYDSTGKIEAVSTLKEITVI